jgi:hypothetical protein
MLSIFYVIQLAISDSKLLDFELLDCLNLFFQRPGLPGGLKFKKLIKLIQLAPLNMITDNVINWLILSNLSTLPNK